VGGQQYDQARTILRAVLLLASCETATWARLQACHPFAQRGNNDLTTNDDHRRALSPRNWRGSEPASTRPRHHQLAANGIPESAKGRALLPICAPGLSRPSQYTTVTLAIGEHNRGCPHSTVEWQVSKQNEDGGSVRPAAASGCWYVHEYVRPLSMPHSSRYGARHKSVRKFFADAGHACHFPAALAQLQFL